MHWPRTSADEVLGVRTRFCTEANLLVAERNGPQYNSAGACHANASSSVALHEQPTIQLCRVLPDMRSTERWQCKAALTPWVTGAPPASLLAHACAQVCTSPENAFSGKTVRCGVKQKARNGQAPSAPPVIAPPHIHGTCCMQGRTDALSAALPAACTCAARRMGCTRCNSAHMRCLLHVAPAHTCFSLRAMPLMRAACSSHLHTNALRCRTCTATPHRQHSLQQRTVSTATAHRQHSHSAPSPSVVRHPEARCVRALPRARLRWR